MAEGRERHLLLATYAFQWRHDFKEADIIGHKSDYLFGADVVRQQSESDRQALESEAPVICETHQFRRRRRAARHRGGQRGHPRRGRLAARHAGIARDITRRKEEEAQSVSGAKSRFLSNMSHESRTPMNAVLGMLSLLRTTELSPSHEEFAGKAEARRWRSWAN